MYKTQKEIHKKFLNLLEKELENKGEKDNIELFSLLGMWQYEKELISKLEKEETKNDINFDKK